MTLLWWPTASRMVHKMFLKYTVALYPCCYKMLQNPSLILYHYKSYSISRPLCSPHPLLPVNIRLLALILSIPYYCFSCLHLSSHFSPVFAIPFAHSCTFIFCYIFLCVHFIPIPCPHLPPDKWSQSHACTLVGYRRREEEKSGLAYEAEGDDERIRCFVWMT